MTVPNVDERRQTDVDIQLWLGRPDSPSGTNHERAYEFMLRDAHDIAVSYSDGSDHNALTFKMYKDSPGARELTGDWEIIVRWWDPRRQELLEPPGSRFVILETEEDMADNTNAITYKCASITWLLEKVRVRTTGYVNNAARMNRDYDRAKKRYEDAERDYDQARREFERIGRQVQRDTWHQNQTMGPMLLSYSGVTWLIRDRIAKYRSIVYNDYNGLLYWYSYQRQGMVRLNMNPSNETHRQRRRDLRIAGRDALRAMTRMRTARTNYNNAERAARETSRDGTRYFYNRTPGRVLAQLWREGCERDSGFVGHNDGEGTFDSPFSYRGRVLKGNWRGWTNTRDSKGQLWTSNTTRGNWEIRLGQSLWAVIQDFRERGEIDVRMGGLAPGGGGRSLYLVPKGGLVVDQSRRVAFKLDRNVVEAPETIDRTEHQTVTFVLDSKGLNRYTHWNRGLAANATPWGYWEGAIQEQDADSLSTSMSLTAEERRKRSRRFWVDASRKGPVDSTGPIPMLDYEPHHQVSVYTHQGSGSKRSVSQIIVEKSDPDEPITATIRLGQRIANGPVSYERTLSKVLGGSDHMQGHIPLAPSEAELTLPQDALYAPAITDMGANVRFNEEGRPRVALTATIASYDMPQAEDAARFEASEEGQSLLFDEEYEGT